MLGKLPVSVRLTTCNLIIEGQGPFALATGGGWAGGCLDIFSLIYHFSLLSPSPGDGPI